MLPRPVESIEMYCRFRLSSLLVNFDWYPELPRIIGGSIVPEVVLLAVPFGSLVLEACKSLLFMPDRNGALKGVSHLGYCLRVQATQSQG